MVSNRAGSCRDSRTATSTRSTSLRWSPVSRMSRIRVASESSSPRTLGGVDQNPATGFWWVYLVDGKEPNVGCAGYVSQRRRERGLGLQALLEWAQASHASGNVNATDDLASACAAFRTVIGSIALFTATAAPPSRLLSPGFPRGVAFCNKDHLPMDDRYRGNREIAHFGSLVIFTLSPTLHVRFVSVEARIVSAGSRGRRDPLKRGSRTATMLFGDTNAESDPGAAHTRYVSRGRRVRRGRGTRCAT